MARAALAVQLGVDLAPAPSAETVERPAPAAKGAQNARALQHRLHEAYAPPAIAGKRELSPFSRLAIIVGASGLLWGVIALAVSAVI